MVAGPLAADGFFVGGLKTGRKGEPLDAFVALEGSPAALVCTEGDVTAAAVASKVPSPMLPSSSATLEVTPLEKSLRRLSKTACLACERPVLLFSRRFSCESATSSSAVDKFVSVPVPASLSLPLLTLEARCERRMPRFKRAACVLLSRKPMVSMRRNTKGAVPPPPSPSTALFGPGIFSLVVAFEVVSGALDTAPSFCSVTSSVLLSRLKDLKPRPFFCFGAKTCGWLAVAEASTVSASKGSSLRFRLTRMIVPWKPLSMFSLKLATDAAQQLFNLF